MATIMADVCICRECLRGQIDVTTSAVVDCPFANDDYCCGSQLQDREIRAVCTIFIALVFNVEMTCTFFIVGFQLPPPLLAVVLFSPMLWNGFCEIWRISIMTVTES